MTIQQKIANMAFMAERPFTVAEAADLCDCELETAEKALRKLRRAGSVDYHRRNGRLIYVAKSKTAKKFKPVKHSKSTVEAVCDYLEEYGYTSLREIAKHCRISHEAVRLVIHQNNIEMVNQELEAKRLKKQLISQLCWALKLARSFRYKEQRTRNITS